MISLVLCDVDGTLIPLGQRCASNRTVQAIERLKDAGVRFGLATGRDVSELTKLFDGNTSVFDTGILSNGKRIMVDGELRRLTLVDTAVLQQLADLVAPYGNTFVTAYPLKTDETNPVYCMGTSPEELRAWEQKFSFRGIPTPCVPKIEVIGATIACAQDQDVLDEIISRAQEQFPQFDFVQPAPHWCDVLPAGLNKGTALSLLLDELGIDRDDVVVFGDADNDVALLAAVDQAVVVSNASPAARAASRWCIGSCEDESVARALEDIANAALRGERPGFMHD